MADAASTPVCSSLLEKRRDGAMQLWHGPSANGLCVHVHVFGESTCLNGRIVRDCKTNCAFTAASSSLTTIFSASALKAAAFWVASDSA